MIVANATGCSSIYGGNLPTTPWTKNAEGRGPAWSNSLFEDNAEFGLGFRLTIDKHRDDLSDYAPRIITVQVPPSKIGEIIGPGGKVIRAIVEETGAKIDITDDGTVLIASVDAAAGLAAKARVEEIAQEAEVDKEYDGIVRRVTDFGAFIEIFPGTDGLLHISEMDYARVERVEDICNLGDKVRVKVINVDPDGKVRLSRKALLPVPEGYVAPPPRDDRGRSGGRPGGGRPRGGGGRDRGRR